MIASKKKVFNITADQIKPIFEAGCSDRDMANQFKCSVHFLQRVRAKFGFLRQPTNNRQASTGTNHIASFGRIKGHTWDTQLNGKFEDDPRACERDYVRYCGYVAIQKREAIC